MHATQPNNLYDAVIFDLFGTLVDIFLVEEHDRMTARMATALSAPAEPYTKLWVATFNQRATGAFATTEENIRHVVNELDLMPSDAQVEEAVRVRWDFSRDSLRPKPDAIETLKRLRQVGLKIGLISDCSCEIPGLWNETLFAPFFDSAIFSCSVQIRKPDSRIYAAACEELGVGPEGCLYVGDGGSNELTGAREVGMDPVLLYEKHEDGEHVYRAGAQEWDGRRIERLPEVLECVGGEGFGFRS